MKITIPELSLVLLIGPSGSGKSTFARTHFKPTEVLSSDFCRAWLRTMKTTRPSTGEAFEILHFIARKRLALGRLTVIDATNVQPESRKSLVELAREFHVLPVALVFNFLKRYARSGIAIGRTGTSVRTSIRNQSQQLRRSLRGLEREGFRHVHVFGEPADLEGLEIERQPLWNKCGTSMGRSTSSVTCMVASMR